MVSASKTWFSRGMVILLVCLGNDCFAHVPTAPAGAEHQPLPPYALPSPVPPRAPWMQYALRALRNVLRAARRSPPIRALSRCISLATLFCFLAVLPTFTSPTLEQPQQLPDDPPRQTEAAGTPQSWPERAASRQQETYGAVRGRVIDQTGDGVAGVKVQLKCEQGLTVWEIQSDEDGGFGFDQVPAGRFQITPAEEGFVAETVSNTLQPGENYFVPPMTMHLAAVVTEIRVTPAAEEIAQNEFKVEEQQRLLGVVPNLYVTYVSEAAPLTPKRKFALAFKATTNPVTFGAVGMVAGVNQATDRFSGFGQGSRGYAKRYGASYANFASGLWIGGAVLPSILKQDPRYFYKGTGSQRSRFLYAISRPFVCKGDNRHWQPNYSSVLGDLAAGGISNLYIPERDHHGARLTFENAGIALGTTAAIDILQEFVLHRLTSKGQ